jgi:hypothetical protein
MIAARGEHHGDRAFVPVGILQLLVRLCRGSNFLAR